jgi:HEAT repeat protein
MGDTPSRDALIACLNDAQGPSVVRDFCAGVLPWIGDEVCIAALGQRIRDENTPVELRVECAKSLGVIENLSVLEPLMDPLFNLALPEQLRRVCIQSIRESFDGYLLKALISLITASSTSADVCRLFAFVIAQVGGAQARQALIQRLEDEGTDMEVRRVCAWGLGSIGDEQARQALVKQVGNRDAKHEIRFACAQELAKLSDDDSLCTLEDCFNDPEDEVFRWWCAACFPLSTNESLLASFIDWLNDDSTPEELRLNYVSLLGVLGGVRRRLFLLRLHDDSRTSETVKKACMEAIAAIE